MAKAFSRSVGVPAQPSIVRATVRTLLPDGLVQVEAEGFGLLACEIMLDGARVPEEGDRVLVLPPTGSELAVVLGRLGRYQRVAAQAHLTLEATESLTLKCGEASVELRADGRALLKGEDVTVRAKGTQRIRAGNVAIN